MTILWIMLVSLVSLVVFGRLYSRFLARSIGEVPGRLTPAILRNDGRDYVPSPTPVVFGHHFAAIAGAGPIIGPVIAVVYGWLPALLWVVIGSLAIGAVHDYLAVYMSTREGGESVGTIVRRMLGKGPFIAMMLFLIIMLSLVCATFLNLSAKALVSMLPNARIGLPEGQTAFRVETVKGVSQVVLGGIASMSVIIITLFSPLIGWMYIKRKIGAGWCSLAAVAVCALSIYIGFNHPVWFPQQIHLGEFSITGENLWKFMLSAYVLLAAGVPVWLFLQSRDFVNVHILYVGLAFLLVTLVRASAIGGGQADPLPAVSIGDGQKALGIFWPTLFITIACGAVSGFHSLCAGGTTCKQITNEGAARRIGYYAMLLEAFVSVCVIGALIIGVSRSEYLLDLHPRTLAGTDQDPNAVLGFAVAVGKAANIAWWGLPVAYGALAGMILLEGFLITTLDAAVRLMRYLLEEVWRCLFEGYDVFAPPLTEKEFGAGDMAARTPAGADGITIALEDPERASARFAATTGAFCRFLTMLRHYWVNSGLAVGLMLLFAFSAGLMALWNLFATSNQLLAAMVLSVATLWLLRRGRRVWFVFVPAVLMLVTTIASLILLVAKYGFGKDQNTPLLVADLVLMALTAYLLVAGAREAVSFFRARQAAPARQSASLAPEFVAVEEVERREI